MVAIDLGKRRLQYVNGAYLLNFPIIAARSLNLRAGDELHVSIMEDQSIKIEKIGERNNG